MYIYIYIFTYLNSYVYIYIHTYRTTQKDRNVKSCSNSGTSLPYLSGFYTFRAYTNIYGYRWTSRVSVIMVFVCQSQSYHLDLISQDIPYAILTCYLATYRLCSCLHTVSNIRYIYIYITCYHNIQCMYMHMLHYSRTCFSPFASAT